ncbi:MAG: hypothetical protein V2I65_10050 [Paracoccaceae bacterium]|jgi:hypothetical protein|nr:hypothetical protein [Paracoccaceae bacterium]
MSGRDKRGDTLGPATGRNWALVAPLAVGAALLAGSAAEATLRLGPGWRETALPLLLAAAAGAAAALIWRLPPAERCSLRLEGAGVTVAGRRTEVHLPWSEIAAITHRPAGLGAAHMTIERAAGTGAPGSAPGVSFPVRATGARMEDVVAFLGRGAAEAGYRLEEGGRPGAARHAMPVPRLWAVRPG